MASAEEFKRAFGRHPAGVTIITAAAPEGPVGLTASSVASVSLDPLTLLFSVTKAHGAAGHVLEAHRFAVNMLHAEHVDLAREFSVPGGRRFTADQDWAYLEDGVPILTSAHAALVCNHCGRLPVGASTVVVGEVEEILTGPAGSPLVYHSRTYHRLGEAQSAHPDEPPVQHLRR